MLKISAPLEIKAKTTYIRDPEAFYHRIIGGYLLMAAHINEEDLLHITSTPPEIYIAEGSGMTGIYSNILHNEVNIRKVNILNNALNRILLSADMDLTYQDRVFITDTLYKLGIKDDRKFMKAFYRMAWETCNTGALIKTYLEKDSNLIEKVKELENVIKEYKQTEHSDYEKEKENYLYSNILKRLKTGSVYRIISNFNRSVHSNEIDAREFSISDQTFGSLNVFLNMFREQSGEQADELVFIDNNTYEDETLNELSENESIKKVVNCAVMMDLVKTIYHIANDRFHENSDTYYRLEDTFYKASEQTILRLVNRVENNFFKVFETEKLIEKTSNISESEIELLVKEISPEVPNEEIKRIAENITLYNLLNEKRRLLSKTVLQQRTAESQATVAETAQIQHETAANEDADTPKESTSVITDEEIKRITESINLLNLQNGKRRLLYEKELQKIQEKQKSEDGLREIERTRKYAALALENPEKLEEILKLNREKFIEKQNNIVRNADISELMQDIRTFGSPPIEAPEPYIKRNPETDIYTEFLRQNANYEAIGNVRGHQITPVETVHKSSVSLSGEEITEQLDIIQKNLAKQINKTSEHSALTENHISKTTEIINNETQVNRLSRRDIEQLIENGVQSRITSLSNRVMKKIEKQMKNEKMRRGY
ncbi:MAG: hypothetical protein J5802_07955 [Butyrivibrio sp.]|nr:hypothetical protein [Butyrivibrio sp.]